MKKNITDAELDQLIKEVLEVSDDELADIMDQAKIDAELTGEAQMAPPAGGFEDVMRRVAQMEQQDAAKKKRLSGKKLLRPLAIAAVLGTILLGTGVNVAGKKEYEFVKRIKSSYSIGYNNADAMTDTSELDLAYQRIRDEIGIRPIMLEYMPEGMKFEELLIERDRATLVFSYADNFVNMQQVLKGEDTSINSLSDRHKCTEFEHRSFGMIGIYSNELANQEVECSTHIVIDNAYYFMNGVIAEDEFIKIVQQLGYYE